MSLLEQGVPSIAVDAMGSDLGPAEMVAGVSLALQDNPQLGNFVLVGDQEILEREHRAQALGSNVTIQHASQVIGMDEKPIESLKKKKDSSLLVSVNLVKENQCHFLLSCGNTGSLMAASTLRLRTVAGIDRPALGSVIPSRGGNFILIDAGANPQPDPEHLLTNALLGSNYARIVLGIAKPRIGLLTIGTEEGKGTELVNQAHQLLSQNTPTLNYIGLMEGFQVFENHCDVVVCDGFTGNIVLKVSHGLFSMLKGYVKDEILLTPRRKVGGLLCKPAFDSIKNSLNPEYYGGAPFLGLRGHVMKAHGSSNRHFIKNALRIGSEIIKQDLHKLIEADIQAIPELKPKTQAKTSKESTV